MNASEIRNAVFNALNACPGTLRIARLFGERMSAQEGNQEAIAHTWRGKTYMTGFREWR